LIAVLFPLRPPSVMVQFFRTSTVVAPVAVSVDPLQLTLA
jgi:hypothetical protein